MDPSQVSRGIEDMQRLVIDCDARDVSQMTTASSQMDHSQHGRSCDNEDLRLA